MQQLAALIKNYMRKLSSLASSYRYQVDAAA
jgi:hypothetical protein